MKIREELEVIRHDVTPAQFCAYVRHMIKKHNITGISAADINTRYLMEVEEIEFDYHGDPTRPCKAERSIGKPGEKQTYVLNWNGDVFNQIIEFEYDDEKTGHGYFYYLNDIDDDRKDERQQDANADTEPEPAKAMKRTTPKKTSYNFKALFDTLAAAEAADVSVYHGPRGNSKLGEIPAFNLLPGCSCSPEARAHCMVEGCYAVKNVFCHGYNVETNNTLRAWTDNTVLAKHHIYTLETQIESFLNQNRPQFFRIHSAGDFITVKYARMWYRIAKRHPDTRFLAFTKQWDIIRHVFFYRVPNFELVLSGWTGISIPEDLRKHYRCAWCDDGIENRIPADAIECPGNCDTCGMCWHLSELGRDTKFHKH